MSNIDKRAAGWVALDLETSNVEPSTANIARVVESYLDGRPSGPVAEYIRSRYDVADSTFERFARTVRREHRARAQERAESARWA